MKHAIRLATCGSLMILLCALPRGVVSAADWPGWRGPARDGYVPDFVPPGKWPEQLKKRWSVQVGEGHSSPVSAGDRIFVFTRQGEQEVVRALSATDGKELWADHYAAPYEMHRAARAHGKGPKSTPVVADGRLFTLGISGILTCWDAESGKRLWQHKFTDRFRHTSPLYGTATSPLVEGNLLIVHVGGHDDGALTAFDTATGQVRWQWTGDGPAYTSPIVATVGKTRQIITQSQEATIGVDVASGELLWQFPFETEYTMNIVTPVLVGDVAVFSGFRKGTFAYRIAESDGRWQPEPLWHNSQVSMFMSSPVVIGRRLLAFSHQSRGRFVCLELDSGKTVWTSDGRMGENAALLVIGDKLLALTTESQLWVIDPAAEQFKVIARYGVADTPTWAHPLVRDGEILVKDRERLTCWALQ